MTKRPPLHPGHTYDLRFIDSQTGRQAYQTLITISDHGDHTAAAVNAYISRWIRHGRHTYEIREIG